VRRGPCGVEGRGAGIIPPFFRFVAAGGRLSAGAGLSLFDPDAPSSNRRFYKPAENAPMTNRSIPVTHLLAWLGRFHILVIHFPIALLIAAAIAETWAAWRGTRSPSPVVRFCVLLGAVSTVAAVALGWFHADFGGYGADMPRELDLHRWLGTAAGLWAVGTAVLYERGAWRHRWSRLSRIAVVTGAILVSAAAHFGGTLVHGEGFLDR
jgi:hypothetical protein